MRELRVLVLDPHVTRRAALAELLAGWGMDVEGCGDTEAALMAVESACLAQQFAVVLMTSEPGAVEANELAARLRGVCGPEAPPIVQLTASALAAPATAVGAWPTLSSPPRQSQLLDLLAALVDAKPGGLNRFASRKAPAAGATRAKPVAENAPRVLVIDDSEVNRRVAERMLARLGYRTESGDSGLVAINRLARGTYAAVLMDCRMPDMDGFSATTRIRHAEGSLRRTPIIAMTANAELGDRERCLAAGMDGYLAKPVQLAEMERVLRQWIDVAATDSVGVAAGADDSGLDGVLDAEVLAQLRALDEPGDASLLTELCEAFRDSAPGHVQRLKTTLAAGDATAFGDAAHALKGSSAALGATRLRMAAANLERRGRDNDLAHVDAQLQALEEACTEAVEALFHEVARSAQEPAA